MKRWKMSQKRIYVMQREGLGEVLPVEEHNIATHSYLQFMSVPI